MTLVGPPLYHRVLYYQTKSPFIHAFSLHVCKLVQVITVQFPRTQVMKFLVKGCQLFETQKFWCSTSSRSDDSLTTTAAPNMPVKCNAASHFFFNLFIYAPFLKSSLGFFAQFWRLFVRLEFLVFNRLYWATIACFCCAAREETSFPSCFGGPIKKCNIATICELLQNKVQFLLQRKQSHRPPIELRQLCYPPVGSVPMLPPEKAHVIDVTCLRWPVGLKWPHSTHLCREQMVQMWWLSNNPLILVCFCCWQKKKKKNVLLQPQRGC